MKTNTIFLPLLIAAATFLFSCESSENEIQESTIESTNISDLTISAEQLEFNTAPNERFRYNLNLAEGEEASIVTGAENAYISRISGNGIYIHIPEENFIGTDSVLIAVESESEPVEDDSMISVGNLRYVYITLHVEEETTEVDEIEILTGACGHLIFQDKLGDDYESAESALVEIRASILTSHCPGNPCFESYHIENVDITTNFDIDDREFFGIRYQFILEDGTQTNSFFSLSDVLDSEGNYYRIEWCLGEDHDH